MLSVELDIFSGRPNPSWILTEKDEKELFDRLIADPSLMRPVSASPNRLGYRGYIISRLDEEQADSQEKKAKFPTRFRLGSGLEGPEKGAEASLWLLDTSEQLDTEVDDYLREVARDSILRLERPQSSSGGPENIHEKTGMSCVANYLTSSTDFSFWNGTSYYQANNNCYNFASNKRTNTYAQPGRSTGHIYSAFTCANVTAAIKSDGWAASCRASNNLSICLVIWPNRDFHFYRFCSGGRWCHKLAGAPAKNTDESGRSISNPQTCNRGVYTQFCDYWFADNSVIRVL